MSILARTSSSQLGFTLLEVIVVAAILGIMAISTAPFITGTLEKRRLMTETEKVVTALKSVQQQSLIAEAGLSYGALFETKQIVLKPENLPIQLYGRIEIQNAEPAQITFGKLTGVPQLNGIPTPVSLQLVSSRFKTTVTISQAGAISWSAPERK